jgi:hypothetical protein
MENTADAQPQRTRMAVGTWTSWKETPAMTGSFLVPIITPIVAILALACWLGMVFLADAHPGWKTHHAAEESQFAGESPTLAGDLEDSEPASVGHGKAA